MKTKGLPEGTKPDVFIQPGKLYATRADVTIMTILGSCVAVCLWHPKLKAGGMNHFLLPETRVIQNIGANRYGNRAIQNLIEKIEAFGCSRVELKAKVFGGARVLTGMNGSYNDLGERNVETAFAMLREEGIQVVSSDTLGHSGRKLIFKVADGTAWVKEI